MDEGSSTQEEIIIAAGLVSSHVWRAKLTLYVIKPLMFLWSLVVCGAGLYGATWIVVLALRHSGAIR